MLDLLSQLEDMLIKFNAHLSILIHESVDKECLLNLNSVSILNNIVVLVLNSIKLQTQYFWNLL